jgi:hypothetical protein
MSDGSLRRAYDLRRRRLVSSTTPSAARRPRAYNVSVGSRGALDARMAARRKGSIS